ncbi:hypothetical protein DFP74_2612 [Nocardiopsis sp. Huas11]|uniref:DUF5691 domain-containing protein n=1 Tax=Nocardiopsis sp. Huas11 TaxID=2183912 RepID=UPI000EB31008|nr:DUF5691 domain-containing protein [Nocardiopsis sp. Huas11]RKS06962.1 hypothetical protein DFP74_2612 [Nocardiopsis sp. Huas11]
MTTPPSDSWDLLVSAALVGTGRRAVPDTPELPATPADAPARVLLDRAALAAVRRDAGYTPSTRTPVTPDEEPERPEVGAAAERRLAEVLASRPELLPEWLRLAAAAGLSPARATVPDLLDRGVGDSELRPMIVAAVGPRARWLARFTPAWSYAHAVPLPGDRYRERDWTHGTPGERRHALAALRATDPAAARALLEAAWPGLRQADQRRHLLETLATGLGNDDEPLLDRALDDRSATVRGQALALLTRLPESAHAHRLRGYVRELARVDERGGLTVDPVAPDRSDILRDLTLVAADGEPETAATRAERASTLVTHTPMDVWTDLLGQTPDELVARLERSDDVRLRETFAGAAGLQGDTVWARALLGAVGTGLVDPRSRHYRDRGALRLAGLFAALAPDERCRVLLDAVDDDTTLLALDQVIRMVPGPWSPELCDWVVRRLQRPLKRKSDVSGFRVFCSVAAEHLAPELHTALPDSPPADGDSAAEAPYLRLRDTLRFRHDMTREL